MAKNLAWLRDCKSSQLKAIATAIGVNSVGTKPALTSRLLQHLPYSYFDHATANRPIKPQFDIVSIDMGIRNLAYCRLQSPPSPPLLDSSRSLSNEIPVITEWARVAISESREAEAMKAKEVFDPLTYSAHAFTFISTLLRTYPQPTQILIERQRFRSMGGSAVQEWTLRVNMFEAMLYAVLKTLSEKGLWNGKVYAVAPGKVAKFWLGEKEGLDEDGTGKGAKSARKKGAKIALVARWLEGWREGNGIFGLVGEAEEIGRAYLRKREGVRRKRSNAAGVDKFGERNAAQIGTAKLDDLADCLLQGMAWVKWEQNRKMIMSR